MTILNRMIIRNLIKPRLLIGAALTIMAIVAFNLGQPALKSDLLTSFNDWYQIASPKLMPLANLKDADLSLSISVTLRDSARGPNPIIWQLPGGSLLDAQERDMTARALQLIKESGVFGFQSPPPSASAEKSIEISVQDNQRQFKQTISLEIARENIQLGNLITLMDVYSNANKVTDVNTSRL